MINHASLFRALELLPPLADDSDVHESLSLVCRELKGCDFLLSTPERYMQVSCAVMPPKEHAAVFLEICSMYAAHEGRMTSGVLAVHRMLHWAVFLEKKSSLTVTRSRMRSRPR